MAGLLDAIGQGLAYGSDEQVQNRADAREYDNYEKKLKLAQDMQLRLEERKMQLSQQYPQLMQATKDYGVITGIFNDGSVKELSRDEGARQAELDKAAASAEYYRSRGDLAEAQTAVGGYRPPAPAKPPTEKAPSVSMLNTVLKEAEKDASAPYIKKVGSLTNDAAWRALGEDEQQRLVQEAYQKRINLLRQGKGASPEAAVAPVAGVEASGTKKYDAFGDL